MAPQQAYTVNLTKSANRVTEELAKGNKALLKYLSKRLGFGKTERLAEGTSIFPKGSLMSEVGEYGGNILSPREFPENIYAQHAVNSGSYANDIKNMRGRDMFDNPAYNHSEMFSPYKAEPTKLQQRLLEHAHSKQASINTQQAYIEGFVKRAVAHGISEAEAFELLKSSVDNDSISQPGMSSATSAPGPERYVPPAPPIGVPAVSLESLDSRNKGSAAKKPKINPAHLNDLGRFTPR